MTSLSTRATSSVPLRIRCSTASSGEEPDGAFRLFQQLQHARKFLQASVTNLHRIPLACQHLRRSAG